MYGEIVARSSVWTGTVLDLVDLARTDGGLTCAAGVGVGARLSGLDPPTCEEQQ
jgi:hypothetical protein